jgi:hypothetical protein
MITNKYRSDFTKSFRDGFEDNEYYLFVSDTEESQVENTLFSTTRFLEKTIFGKRIDQSNVFFVIQNIIWQGGEVFDQYDDGVDLSRRNFYAVVYPSNNDTGDYRVFKCLFNNYDSPSIVPPNFDPNNPEQIYRMSDGYVWKHMFAVSELDFDRYIALGFFPIIDESIYSPTPSTELTSQINQIFIENFNSNAGYEEVQVLIGEVDAGIVVLRSEDLSEIRDFYTGRVLYTTNIENASSIYEITSYVYDATSGTGRVTLKDFSEDDIVVPQSTAKILPRIEINGDGTGASAIPIIDGTRIERILMFNPGTGYTNATARVIDPFNFDPGAFNSTDERAILRPILSPRGGHASDPVEELNCRRLLLYTDITLSDNDTFSPTNVYTKIGLVKNPDFYGNTAPSVFDNRLELELDTAESLFVGEQVSQSTAGQLTFEARVHEVANNVVYLTDFNGPFANFANTDISFNPSIPLASSQNQLFSINSITIPQYVQKTGDVYYAIDFEAVERTSDSREAYKIILEF